MNDTNNYGSLANSLLHIDLIPITPHMSVVEDPYSLAVLQNYYQCHMSRGCDCVTHIGMIISQTIGNVNKCPSHVCA